MIVVFTRDNFSGGRAAKYDDGANSLATFKVSFVLIIVKKNKLARHRRIVWRASRKKNSHI